MSASPAPAAIDALLARVGVTGAHRVTRLPGGRNNQAFRVEAMERTFFLKAYFQHDDDPRDRAAAEWAFSRFAWDRALRCLPEPLAHDPVQRLGLYEFVQGRALTAEDVTDAAVGAAIDFVRGLNQARTSSDDAHALPAASEACFSVDAHLAMVQTRLHRLRTIEHDAARSLIEDRLLPASARVLAAVPVRANQMGIAPQTELPRGERVISPSDFGFHNAMVGDDGRIRFFDFEYAGWDDPAKLACDFFCQVQVPVPLTYWDTMTRAVMPVAEDRARADLLLPAYRVKWCCILLNDFLPDGRARRGFAAGYDSIDLDAQLGKARSMIEALNKTS